MFVALRDLRAARGRFGLIITVVVLMALLVSFLSGLTAGLRHQNVSAVETITADSLVFADTGSDISFDESVLSPEQIHTWQNAAHDANPIGISRGKAGVAQQAQTSVSLFGADAGVGDRAPTRPHTVVLSEGAADSLGARAGDSVTVGDQEFSVDAIRGDDWYSHTPVVWMTLSDWQSSTPGQDSATVLAVSGVDDAPALDTAATTTSRSVTDSFEAIGSFSSENASLTVMTLMLVAISALVIGAFFTVWTIQRTADIATLKALGATTASLVRDALGQALIVLVVGVAAGVGLTAVASVAIGDGLPFVLDTSTTLIPAAALTVLGLLGAGFALRFLSTTDPLVALGSTR